MKVGGTSSRSLWTDPDDGSLRILDQTLLPHEVATRRLGTPEEVAEAIVAMRVRGAPLIGAAAAHGLALGLEANPDDEGLEATRDLLLATRPTAVNLRWALDQVTAAVRPLPPGDRAEAAAHVARQIADEDVARNRLLGEVGLELLRAAWEARGRRPVRILTHCNAGWLATVDLGTATAPIYLAHDAGLPLHVWVSETRPRNQGGALTAWELGQEGIPHTVVVDNACGHLMQRGEVDLCLVGTDRTSATGDVVNKIGTYLKALAARATGVPFYVAAPSPSIDWSLDHGDATPIEERGGDEVTHLRGRTARGDDQVIRVVAPGSPVLNPAFDVTPAHLVTGLITERGVTEASRSGLAALFPEQAREPGP
jgi:methylthioribose-1-phosphate isomerase